MYNRLLKDIGIVCLTSISGGVMWKSCGDVYNIHINKRFIYKKNDIKNFVYNLGTFIGFGLGVSYVFTGKPLVYNLYFRFCEYFGVSLIK
tara:strand:+ start:400 stop:669 length:270 start_codon:yes stop_codon:yes gene_type:complete